MDKLEQAIAQQVAQAASRFQRQRTGHAPSAVIRDILVQEQDHQVALASALGIEVPNATRLRTPIDEHSRINAGITRELKPNPQATT